MPNSTLDCLDMEGFDNSKSLYVPREMYERRGELLRDALEFIDGMSLAEAALRIEIRKELDNA